MTQRKPDSTAEREARQAEKLRENLRRRKAQMREREAVEPPSSRVERKRQPKNK